MLLPGAAVGRYTVQSHIASGSQAQVFRVLDEHGQPFALKWIGSLHPDVRQRFVREASILQSLDHPHIVRGLELLELPEAPLGGAPAARGALGLVMEWVDGPPLNEWLRQPRSASDRVEVARQLVQAMAHAHGQGTIHRDLKPSNVLVAERSSGPWVRITDFGLAKHLTTLDSATRTGLSLGTPRYMAPEQAQDAKRVDARADVWSLGAVLYELFVGRPAFPQRNVLDVLAAVTEGRYDPPGPEVPHAIRTAVDGALRVDPDRRFADAREMYVVLTTQTLEPVETVRRPPPELLSPPPPPAASLLAFLVATVLTVCCLGGLVAVIAALATAR